MSDNEMRAEREFSDDERRLYDLMSEISEDCYFAGWMSGNEHALWDAITTGDLSYGQGDMDRELLAQVAALSVKTGRWIIWRDDHDGLDPHDSSEWGPYSITIADWLARRSIPQGDEPAGCNHDLPGGQTPAKTAETRMDAGFDGGGQQGDELPPLPQAWRKVYERPHGVQELMYYTADDMREYGAACRAGRAKGEAVAWAVVAPRGGIHKLSITKESADRKMAKWLEEWPDNKPSVRPLVFGDTAGAKGEDARDDDADNLSVMLWLLRRLPRAYENPPHIVQAIERLAERTGTDVSDSFSERRAAATAPEGKGKES